MSNTQIEEGHIADDATLAGLKEWGQPLTRETVEKKTAFGEKDEK